MGKENVVWLLVLKRQKSLARKRMTHDKVVLSLAFSPDSKTLASGSNNSIKLSSGC
jgi:WD40 repeat protein